MNDLLKKLAGLDTKKTSVLKESVNERGMSMNVDEWETDPAAHDQELIDSWHDQVVDALNQYEIDGPLSDKELEELCRAVSSDLNDEVDHKTVHKIIAGELDQREHDHANDGSYDSSDDAAALASAGHGSDEDYGTYEEGAEFGAYDYEQLAQAVYDKIPHLDTSGRAAELISTGHIFAKKMFGDKEANYLFRHEDFPADFVSSYSYLQKQHAGKESAGAQGDVGGAHGEETISPVHGESMEKDLSMESLRVLSGLNKAINECGIPSAMGASTPASINITAANGSELTGMLKDIMNLAGVQQVTPQHMPIDVIASPAEVDHMPVAQHEPDMATLIKAVDQPEANTDSMNDHEEETDESSGEKEENRPWDSSPHEKIRQDGVRKFGDSNSGDGKGRIGTQPNARTTESVAERLYSEYKKFVAEAAADEPAAPDADAIAKRKRLQAIKDRQEDAAAEKSYKKDSNVRVHHAKHDDADMDEGYDSRDAYQKSDPKHPDFKKNFEKYHAANSHKSRSDALADFVKKMKSR